MLADNYIDVVQGTPEWMEMRKGMVTGSMVRYAVAKLATQPSLSKKCKDGKHETCEAAHCICQCHPGGPSLYQKCREDYMVDIVTTRLTGRMSDRYVSKAMEDGIEREPDALIAYEEATGEMVAPGGFVYHPEIEWYGTSPDGLCGEIVIEAKCPTQATHLRYIREYLESKKNGLEYVPEEYLPQVKSHLGCCTEQKVCHFISFHPEFPKNLRLLVSPWHRDNGMIEEQEREVCKFLKEAEEEERFMRASVLVAE